MIRLLKTLKTHRTNASLATVLGAATLLWLWPDAALADDCLRDPFDAEDCLRTSGWAPVLAGVAVWLTSVFANLGEVGNTLRSLASRVRPGAASAANTTNVSSQYVQTSANASGKMPHKSKGWWTWVNNSLLDTRKTWDPDGSEEVEDAKKEAKRMRGVAQKSILPVRVILGTLAAGAVWFSAPWVGLGLVGIAVFYPDILGLVTDFVAGEED